MKLYEVKDGDFVTISVTNAEKAVIEYKVQVLFVRQQILFVEPIRVQDTIVNFSGDDLKITITYAAENEMPVVWKGCMVKCITYDNKKYHILYCANEGKHINRRDTYRQYIGTHGVLQLGANRKAVDVTVKDISVTGVSFVSITDYDEKDIGLFHLNYTDEEFHIPVQITGKVIRHEQLEDTRLIYGCAIHEANVNIGKYIARKQKKEAERRRVH